MQNFVVCPGRVGSMVTFEMLASHPEVLIPIWADLPFFGQYPDLLRKSSKKVVPFFHIPDHLTDFEALVRKFKGRARMLMLVRDPFDNVRSCINYAVWDSVTTNQPLDNAFVAKMITSLFPYRRVVELAREAADLLVLDMSRLLPEAIDDTAREILSFFDLGKGEIATPKEIVNGQLEIWLAKNFFEAELNDFKFSVGISPYQHFFSPPNVRRITAFKAEHHFKDLYPREKELYLYLRQSEFDSLCSGSRSAIEVLIKDDLEHVLDTLCPRILSTFQSNIVEYEQRMLKILPEQLKETVRKTCGEDIRFLMKEFPQQTKSWKREY